MAGAISSVTTAVQVAYNWTATQTVTGTNGYSQQTNKSYSNTISTAAANAAANGGDMVYYSLQSVGTSSSVSIDLTSITNIVGTAAGTFARIKRVIIRLLGTGDTAADGSTAGSAASSVIVGNGATPISDQSNSGFLVSTSSLVLCNGATFIWDQPNAAGVVVDSTHKILKIANNDASVVAKVEVIVVGGSS